MVDAIDECAVGQLKEFEGKKHVSAIKESLKLDEREDGMLSKHQTGSRPLDLKAKTVKVEEERQTKRHWSSSSSFL
ncbi:hypothetical protein VitviT2T_017214 [Vitis vinifera]|uniref:Uncharacterized protein n=1 Tax=Vitis vinifera TaxID=29760 RepID=A0ABY9CTQ6_VITVI|nr:hypothetical protein VitviT2T_017214 [Vitis vinifera]